MSWRGLSPRGSLLLSPRGSSLLSPRGPLLLSPRGLRGPWRGRARRRKLRPWMPRSSCGMTRVEGGDFGGSVKSEPALAPSPAAPWSRASAPGLMYARPGGGPLGCCNEGRAPAVGWTPRSRPVLSGSGAVKFGRCRTCDVASPKTVIAGLDPAIQPSAGALPGPWLRGSILGSTARGQGPRMTMGGWASPVNVQSSSLNRTALGRARQ